MNVIKYIILIAFVLRFSNNENVKLLKLFNLNSPFLVCVIFVLLTAFFLRTYGLPERIALGSDSTRDVVIAQQALLRNDLPLFGSFSSAGPFVFGPLYFWFNMIALAIFPFFKSPWILMNIVGFLTVPVMMYAGYKAGGKRLCIIVGLVTAFCPQFVSRSTGLSQHSLVGITTALLVLFFILLYQTGKLRYAFLVGLSIGVALSMHYQALNLLIFIPAILLCRKLSLKSRILAILISSFAFALPSLPLMYWDSKQDFANFRNVLDYIFIGQYRIYVANSWKIYLLQFLPDYWSNVIGGNKPVAYLIMIVTFTMFLYQSLKRNIKGEIFLLGGILGTLLVIIRYYRGERFDGYMIYVAPLMFLLSSWALLALYDLIYNSSFIKRYGVGKRVFTYFSLVVFAGILMFDFKNASQFIFNHNQHERNLLSAINALETKYPNSKFQIYDYYWRTTDMSYAIGALLNERGKLSKDGLPIGVYYSTNSYCLNAPVVYNEGGWSVAYLGKLNPNVLKKPEWSPSNPEDIYQDLILRWEDQKLTSSFSILEFIKNKIRLN